MAILLWCLAVLLVAVGLAGLVLPVIPGVPLIFLGIVAAAWAEGFTKIGGVTLTLCGVLATIALAVDYVAGVLGAKRMGATPWGLLGAVVGTVVGLFFGIPGLILGPAAGAIGFEYWKDPDFKKASQAGAGVVIGFVLGVVAKCAIALTMLGLATIAYVV
jgi:uncharacterized protein YqgC (DUF456 family)